MNFIFIKKDDRWKNNQFIYEMHFWCLLFSLWRSDYVNKLIYLIHKDYILIPKRAGWYIMSVIKYFTHQNNIKKIEKAII